MGKAQNTVDALNNRISTHANFAKYEINDWIIPILDVQKHYHILDIACGNGKQLIPISKIIDEAGSITGLDISQEMLNEIHTYTKKNKNTILKQGKMENIDTDFEDSYFDLIFCCFGLYYSTNYKRTIKDIYNKLKNNRKCFVCGPIKGNNLELTEIHEVFGKLPREYVIHNNFIETKALPYFKSIFSEVKIEIFENPITFPNKEALLRYWKSYTLFEREVQNEFENSITDVFRKDGKFITKKIVMGITAKK